MTDTIRPVLAGTKALVVGIANDHSIAYGCAHAFRTAGAELAITWLNDKARPYVEPLGKALNAYVMQDEARHVAFGRIALRDYYPRLTEQERDEREEFAVDFNHDIRDARLCNLTSLIPEDRVISTGTPRRFVI